MRLQLVRPSFEYAEQVMKYKEEMLAVCREFGEEKVLLTCDKFNAASRQTIVKNGGILENEINDDIGLGKCGIIQRYWITL